jgi:hypothetical protein
MNMRTFVMRTELATRAAHAASSLTDFTRAVRDAGAAKPAKAPSALTVATNLAPSIPPALMASAVATLEAALAGRHPTDPMLGVSLSRLVSAVNAAVKRSGPLIEQALAVALEQKGFVVMRHVAMPVSAAAQNLVAFNEMKALRGVSVVAGAPADGKAIVYDLLVWCRKTKRAVLLEVKRGSGQTELRKIKPITAALKAGSLQIRSHLKTLGITARQVDARLVDYYGRSGFGDEIRITGDRLDRYFGAPVQGLIDAVLAEMRARLFAALPRLLAQALAEAAHGPEPGPRTVTLSGGVRVAPEHVRQIVVPTRRTGKTKPVNVVDLKGSRRAGGHPPALVQ